MFEEITTRKANLGFVWAKAADSGNTYLCPANLAGEIGDLSESELRKLCIDESANPHND